jgi:Flp pilus assembly protein TadG
MMTRKARNEEGALIVLLAFALIAMAGLGAVAMNTNYLSMGKGQLDSATQSAALSAARSLDGTQAGVVGAASGAVDFAARHDVAGEGLRLVPTEDLAYGIWDERRQSFSVPGDLVGNRTRLNAIEVTGRRSASRGNAFKNVMGDLFNRGTSSAERKSLAVGGGPTRARVAPVVLAQDAIRDLPIGRTWNVDASMNGSGAIMFATLNGSFSGTSSQVDDYFAGNGPELNVVNSRVTTFSGPWMDDQYNRWVSRCPLGREIRVPVVEAGGLGRCTSYPVSGFATVRVEAFCPSARWMTVRLVSTRDQDARAGGPNFGTRAGKVFLASRTAAARPAPNIPSPFPVCGCPQPAPPRRSD